MKCTLCGGNLAKEINFKEKDNLDLYAYNHGRIKVLDRIEEYVCVDCGKRFKREELPFVTDSQIRFIEILFNRIDYLAFSEDSIRKEFYEINTIEADRLIQILKKYTDNPKCHYKDAIREYVDCNLNNDIIRRFVEKQNFYEAKIFIELVKEWIKSLKVEVENEG